MNRYIVKINVQGESDLLFLVFTDETEEYVQEAMKTAQEEFHFSGACDLMDYVCDTYGFQWTDFEPDICYGMRHD